MGSAVVKITDFGAVADGRTDCTAAIAASIGDVARTGGGRVVIPPGTYHTGPIHLLDDIDLHLTAGAVLQFSQDPDDYLPIVRTRYEGVDCYNYSPFVYAAGRANISLTGKGILDGSADDHHWWDWTRAGGDAGDGPAKRELLDAAAAGVPVAERRFGSGSRLRPGFVQFVDCRQVLVEGLTIRNSPMWVLHPLLCEDVIIRDVTVDSHGPNNDGCNPESCRNVLITGCTFDTGDDCIAIKSGKDHDGRRVNVPCENVVITDCLMRAGHGGITLGSETSGGIRNVVGERCTMDSPDLKRALRIKSSPRRGGVIENVRFRDITIGSVADAVIEIALDYENVRSGPYPPTVRDIEFSRVTAATAAPALNLVGLPEAPITDVRLIDCSFASMRSADRIEHVIGLQQ
ncbi:glycoside hydrolase family 28 protein [Microlunatus elymi]|uniref:Glycoside hydrolase family 28 protein n=1 Tax=Microlunatus elymi TaxID=2596828 RepID=A0A516Q0X4_9ACTN|nr:glycoside hydrolase family 28 protein [Microlunatus elymi]QDP97084.1 glycoside hydrolase family 28 protein [Microlunatus elymi]